MEEVGSCWVGAVAQAHYRGLPRPLADEVKRRLPRDLLTIVDEFEARWGRAGEVR